MTLTQKAQHSSGFFFLVILLFAYFGDVLWRLSHGFKYIYRRWQVNIFKISNRVRISPWVFHLGNILHHFGLKLRVYRSRLNHGQPVERAHAGKGVKKLRKRAELLQVDKGKLTIYRTLNFISCTAMLSQNPSMANFEAV